VKRGRGRPSRAAKPEQDGALVIHVRARPKGTTVENACADFRARNGARVGTVDQLVRRYKRCAHAYPDFAFDGYRWLPGLGPVRVKQRMEPLAGTRALTWPVSKPSKY
jgi:hypothetical protein